MPPDLAEYLDRLVRAARSLLGNALLGAYLTGSVALDAYEPGRSDVDVALVVTRPLTDPERESLVARLRHEALPCPARGLELVVYRADVAAAGGSEPGFELELNTGAGMPFRATFGPDERPVADGTFWYALDRSVLHQSGRTLTGPLAAQVFRDLSDDDARAMLASAVGWWLSRLPVTDPAPAVDDAVLNACRALVRVHDGAWLPKAAAGRRVQELGLAPDALVDRAIAARSGGAAPTGAEARAFLQRVLGELKGFTRRDGPSA